MSVAGWLFIGAGGLVLLEMLTLDFTLLMLALGVAAAAVALQVGASDLVAGVSGVAVAVVSLGFVRPLALRLFRKGTGMRTGTDALLGSSGTVVERVDVGSGRVRLRGEVWSARSYDGNVIDAGATADVVAIEGATAVLIAHTPDNPRN